MSRFAKLPLAVIAVLAMLFLMPGLAWAGDAAAPSDVCAADPAATGCPAATTTGSEAGATATSTETPPQDAVVPKAVTDVPPLPPCVDLAHLSNCIPPCAVEPFKSSPVCTTTLPPPPPACHELTDLPHCTPSCEFLAHVLHQDGFCTKLPHCLPADQLPASFPPIPGIPVCDSSGPSTTPPPPSSSPGGVYYKNCADARAHGASNIHRGQPGYRKALDRDNDGIACESSTPAGSTKTPPPKAPAQQPVAAPVVDQLAYTGAVPAPVTAAGFALMLGGAALLRLSRRPR